MYKILPLLLRERCRRCRKFVTGKPLLAVGLLGSAVYLLAGILAEPVCVSDWLDHPAVAFAVMVYLIAKIINPTQGMTLDYQLLELKLLSLREYKLLLGIKLFGGSILLSLVCLGSYTKMAAVISAMNIVVNVWVFLRNRWNHRVYDLCIAAVVVVCMRYQAPGLSVLSMLAVIGIYVGVKRVNYESILSLYKLIYQIGQQRYGGVVYSETESRDIQTNAETLIGKAKEKHSDWCERFYEQKSRFMAHKELARLMANSDKVITYFIICVVIGMSGFYIPEECMGIAFLVLVVVAMSFDMVMNRSEANLLLRGFAREYAAWDIIKNKLVVYTGVNFLFMLPSVMLGWKWLALAAACSFVAAVFCLYKCFKIKK